MNIQKTANGYEFEDMTASGLAPRESQALLLLAAGYTYSAAADQMGCGVKSLAGRIQNLFYKLRANNGPQLIVQAIKTGHLTVGAHP
ncbi:MAG TPA: LuxR C-terminal-related transcriptional regulator [Cellvibrionaceae bacterium]